MKDKLEFYHIVKEIDGREPSELSRLMGDYDFNRYVVKMNLIGPVEDAPVVPVVVRVSHAVAGFPEGLLSSPIRRTALEDLLTRKLAAAIQAQATFNEKGLARKRFYAPTPGQKILPRSTILIDDDHTDVRLGLMLPLQRGRLDGEGLQQAFFDDLPLIVQESLLYCNMASAEVDAFVALMEDADHIRQSLPARGFIGFVGSGSRLGREEGSDRPDTAASRALTVEPSLQVTMETPHAGAIQGLGLLSGVTVILGDVTSGRVELMRALASGIYNHVPGDGRETVIATPDTVYVAAEPGRCVQRVDLGGFLGQDDFSSQNADACQSQAASLVEALEAGARVLLFDEMDSCSGLLGRDDRVDALLGTTGGPVSLAARVKEMAQELGVSTVVAGHASVAAFIPVADTVLAIRDGVVTDITKEAKAKAGAIASPSAPAYDFTRLIETARWVVPSSIDSSTGRHDGVIAADEKNGAIVFGRYLVAIRAAHQLAETQQSLTIGLIMEYMRQRYLDQARPMRELLDLVERDLSTEGLEHISRELRGDLVRPRRYEIAAALNRLPSLRVARAAL